MIFNELTIHTNRLGYEFITAVLNSAGITCFSAEDPDDLTEIMNNKSIPYDYIDDNLLNKHSDVLVKAYFAKNEQGLTSLETVKSGINHLKTQTEFDLGSLETEINTVDDNDWADNWKEFFRPLEIGKLFAVKPSWEEYENPERLVIEIDPESSFGTGQHETTSLCLELLEEENVKNKTVLDMGCGSGILGIGAEKMGADFTTFIDIDQNAVEIAEKNAVINGMAKSKFRVLCGDIISDNSVLETVGDRKYDIILANIVADIISAMAEYFYAFLNRDGILICSGIIITRKDDVVSALEHNGFEIIKSKEKNDWVSFLCRKKI